MRWDVLEIGSKGETGSSKFMPTVWHHTATDFPVINHLNLATSSITRKGFYSKHTHRIELQFFTKRKVKILFTIKFTLSQKELQSGHLHP